MVRGRLALRAIGNSIRRTGEEQSGGRWWANGPGPFAGESGGKCNSGKILQRLSFEPNPVAVVQQRGAGLMVCDRSR